MARESVNFVVVIYVLTRISMSTCWHIPMIMRLSAHYFKRSRVLCPLSTAGSYCELSFRRNEVAALGQAYEPNGQLMHPSQR
jgi:hypothetical protein